MKPFISSEVKPSDWHSSWAMLGRQRFLPIDPDSIADMEDIVAKIKSGAYEHYQGEWHCGTSHCFFGWVIVRELARIYNKQDTQVEFATKYFVPDGVHLPDNHINGFQALRQNTRTLCGYTDDRHRVVACYIYGINALEFYNMADAYNSLDDIESAIAMLKEGFRFVMDRTGNDIQWKGQDGLEEAYEEFGGIKDKKETE